MNFRDFRGCAEEAAAWIEQYFCEVGQYSISPSLSPGDLFKELSQPAPEEGVSLKQLLSDFEAQIVPGLTHWAHPGFFNYFNSSSSEPAVLAEMLAAAVNVNAMLWRSAPIATELEQVTLDWLRQWMGLGDRWFGMLHDSGSLSNFHALAAARQWVAPDYRADGMRGDLVVYASQQAHSSIMRGAISAGFGAKQVRLIETDHEFALRPDALCSAIQADRQNGLRPCCIVAAIGTTSSGAIDPLCEMAAIAREHGAWLHADCAYGGALAIVPEYRSCFTGLETVDSFVINPHKWLFAPIDCSALYTRHPAIFREAFRYVPSYLATNDAAINYMDYGIALTRRFRALKLWFVMRAFGRQAIVAKLRQHMQLCHWLAEQITAHPSFELVAPVTMGLVCFRIKHSDTATQMLVDQVNSTQRFWLGLTQLNGQLVIRVAIGNLRVEKWHVEALWSELKRRVREQAA